MRTVTSKFLVILAVEIILVGLLVFRGLQEGVGSIGPFIISFLVLLIVYPAVLVMNIRAIKMTHNKYLYILLGLNILPVAGFILYSFFSSIT